MDAAPASFSFACQKCGGEQYVLSEFRGSTGGFTAFMNLDLGIFTAVTCRSCGYTEFYMGYLASFKYKFGLAADEGPETET